MVSAITLLRYLLLLGLGVLWVGVTAQDHIYHFNQLTSQEGLAAASSNYYIHQDQEGLIWISSPAGLNRFDGYSVKQYLADPNDPHALSTSNASQSAFYDTPDGKLWFTESGSLVSYDRHQDRFDRFNVIGPKGDTLKSGYNWCYVDTTLQRVWFNTANDFVYTAALEALHDPQLLDSLYINIEAQMYKTQDGYPQLVSFVEDALLFRRYTRDGDNFGSDRLPAPATSKIYEILALNDTLLWVGSNTGLWRCNPKQSSWRKVDVQWLGKPILNISEISVRNSSCFLLGADSSGIYFFDPQTEEITGQVLRLKEQEIIPFIPPADHRLYVDRSDNLWVSTSNDGVLFASLSKPKFSRLYHSFAYQNPIYALGESQQGDIFAVAEKGVFQLHQKATTDYYPLPKIEANFIRPLFFFQDCYRNNWVGTLSALFLRQADEKTFHPFTNIAISPTGGTSGYASMIQLANGDYLIGTAFGPPIRLQADRSAYTILDLDDDLTPIVQLVNQQVFVYGYGNENYLRIYQQAAEDLILDTLIVGLEDINGMVYDQQKYYWIATNSGLYRLQKNDSRWQLSQDTIISKGSINSILIDTEQRLWLGTPQGISSYHPTSTEVHHYQLSDGLQGSHFNRAAAIKTQAGDFVFGGNNGINLFKPENAKSNIAQARPMIVDILINQQAGIAHLYSSNRLYNPAYIDHLTLPFDKNNLELHLAPREYSEPQKCTLSYRLLGSTDDQEVSLGKNRILRFNNLSEGHYRLQIWATNADGVKSSTFRELALSIRPPWYRTGWFFGLLTLLIVAGMYSFYRYRLHIITQRKNAQLAAAQALTKVAESDALKARAEQEKAQSEMAVMRLQMNPHFVFNSLNSIDAYILKEAPMEAHDFLIRFADLMRRILDQSEEQLSTIEEEVNFLKEYLAIEQERFGQRMNFTIYVAPALNTQTTKLPTMVLQPFIENAIVHGISGKQGEGHIQINFLAGEDDQLLIEVKDNGVGRQLKDTPSGHASKATLITQRRLAVLADSLQLATVPHFEIIDEKDDTGNPAGTTVRFFFPQKF